MNGMSAFYVDRQSLVEKENDSLLKDFLKAIGQKIRRSRSLKVSSTLAQTPLLFHVEKFVLKYFVQTSMHS